MSAMFATWSCPPCLPRGHVRHVYHVVMSDIFTTWSCATCLPRGHVCHVCHEVFPTWPDYILFEGPVCNYPAGSYGESPDPATGLCRSVPCDQLQNSPPGFWYSDRAGVRLAGSVRAVSRWPPAPPARRRSSSPRRTQASQPVSLCRACAAVYGSKYCRRGNVLILLAICFQNDQGLGNLLYNYSWRLLLWSITLSQK